MALRTDMPEIAAAELAAATATVLRRTSRLVYELMASPLMNDTYPDISQINFYFSEINELFYN
jgi:hypothetical protein